jgi:hypothetical protein
MIQFRNAYFLLVLGLVFGTGQTGPNEAVVLEISDRDSVSFGLTEEGFIPAWLVAGPFEQPLVGFGQAVDADAIGEATISPTTGETERTALVKDGEVAWKPLHSSPDGFVDFNASMGWVRPGNEPEKIWKAKTGYAFTYIDSPDEQEVILKIGSNSSLKVLLNGETVHTSTADRNAEPDTDTVPLRLHSGRNALLIKVGQTHRNESPNFFGDLRFEWGFYAKLLSPDLIPVQNVSVVVQTGAEKTKAELVSTFFFKEAPEGLQQRFDLVISSLSEEEQAGTLYIRTASAEHTTALERVPFGESRHIVYLPAITAETAAHVSVALGADTLSWDTALHPQPHYEIHLAMMSHTDIGYTNTQPVVKERHLRTLDEVLARLEQDSSFAWTVETVWQLEQYRQARSPEQFGRLMTFVKTGRVAVSPIYTNPYTGWISAEELIRSFNKGHTYARQHGLELNAAIYNDVPGLSWLIPQVLENAGVSFLATGINEVYNDYRMQRNLPKVFYWKGVGGGHVLTYRTEAYNEGQTLGLEKGVDAVPLRLWERLHRLQAQGYTYHLILAVHTFGDNGGIPFKAPATVEAWNAEYAYPRIQISNLDAFAEAFQARYDSLPTLTGDWTSTWDVLYQGEPARVVRQRWVQHHLPTAEKMSTLSWLLDQKHDPLSDMIDSAHDHLLHYSGHGSGLEYGYASPKDNLTTMAYREQYVQDAVLATTEVLERATYRLSAREESFEGEGLYVFNPLNWSRDTPVEVEFPRENSHQYRAIDLNSKMVIPSHFSGYTLRFVARDLPPMGYKKVRLERITHAQSGLGEALQTQDCTIANTYYRIGGDCQAGRITHIVDLESGKTLIDNDEQTTFGSPLRADSLFSLSFEAMDVDKVRMYVRDERPARLVLVTEREGHLFAQSEYILWENLDRVDVQHTVNLELLASPSDVEEYSVAFPFSIPNQEAAIEVLGGFLDAETDRFPGIEHDAFAPRRSIAIHNSTQTISWAAIDSRVARVRKEVSGDGIAIYANLVNNFPENWNRWEPNKGTLDFRFSFTSDEVSFQPAITSQFGWEINTPPVTRYTWLRSVPAQESFITVDDHQVVLLSLKPMSDRSGVVLRLMNMNPETSAEVQISSFLFDVQSGMTLPVLGENSVSYDVNENLARVTLAPGMIKTLGFKLPPR